jgi:hypothetical protein
MNSSRSRSKSNKSKSIKKKIIDRGAYGCIYKESLKCDNGDENKGKISKLQLTEHSTTEANIYQIVDSIDPAYKFHYSSEKCKIHIDEITDARKCILQGITPTGKKNETKFYKKIKFHSIFYPCGVIAPRRALHQPLLFQIQHQEFIIHIPHFYITKVLVLYDRGRDYHIPIPRFL